MIRVLFVCTANICRSPMAEAIFAHLVHEAGLNHMIETDSAGTADWEIDSAPHPGTLFLLERHHIAYDGRGRNLVEGDLNDFDYIITMDNENLRAVKKLGRGRAMTAPLLSFVKATALREIPDPYFDNGFELIYEMIEVGAESLLGYIRQRHQV